MMKPMGNGNGGVQSAKTRQNGGRWMFRSVDRHRACARRRWHMYRQLPQMPYGPVYRILAGTLPLPDLVRQRKVRYVTSPRHSGQADQNADKLANRRCHLTVILTYMKSTITIYQAITI